ncbi:diaminopimelate epimerase [Candidatus Kinetoplastibacterium sorsogonicusi]|nr:diaminopimelate epimerase [Candidatus Kinetoplastibacterium sorsogonicusi]
MKLNFTKMQGIGNDFIVINNIDKNLKFNKEIIQFLSNRKFGIGADQVLLVEKSSNLQADFKYRIFNSDGSEVENCGNGARCFIKFIHQKKLSNKNPIYAEIRNGLIKIESLENNMVKVDMGKIAFDPHLLPFHYHKLLSEKQADERLWTIDLLNNDKIEHIKISIAQISNPHAVTIVDNIQNIDVNFIGRMIESHERFPNHVNVGFMEILNKHNIKLRVYERGVGETLACGTGACAAALSGIRRGLLLSPVTVHTHGGQLIIHWDGLKLEMEGPAETVFEGKIEVNFNN